MSQIPTIDIFGYNISSDLDTNTYKVIITCADPLYYYIIKEGSNIVAERYNINDNEFLYEFEYNGHITEDTEVSVETSSYTSSSFESDISLKSYFVPYDSPYKKLNKPTDFKCSVTDDILTYGFTMPYDLGIYGYSIQYTLSSSISPYTNNNWITLEDFSEPVSYNGGEIITKSIIFNKFENDKYTLFRVYLWGGTEELHSDYTYYSLPKYFPYQTQIVNATKSQPCITRTYKDGQWRQCRLQYYKLYPLISQSLIDNPDVSEIIVDKYNRPIYVAKKETK